MRGFTNGHAQYDDEVPCFYLGISFALSLSLQEFVGSVLRCACAILYGMESLGAVFCATKKPAGSA